MNKLAFEPETRSVASELPTRELPTRELNPGATAQWYVARSKAAGLHFLLSFAVVFCAAMLVVLGWYPGPLLHASGGVKLLVLMIVVDLILGPVLTFSVFDRKKKSLRFDLAFIAVIQLSALTYGLYAAYNGRPVFQVFVVDRIELVSAAEVDTEEIKLADPKFGNVRWFGSTLAAALLPSDPKERSELALSAAAGIDVKHFLRYYTDFTSQRQAILAASRPLAELDKYNDSARVRSALSALGVASPSAPKSLRYLPVQGKREDLTMIIDGHDASLVGLLRLKPWRE